MRLLKPNNRPRSNQFVSRKELSSGADLCQVASNSEGMIWRLPSRAAFMPSSAMPWQLTHHWGFSTGSMMSLLRLQKGTLISLSSVPLSSPLPSSHSTTVLRTCHGTPSGVSMAAVQVHRQCHTSCKKCMPWLCNAPFLRDVIEAIGRVRDHAQWCCWNLHELLVCKLSGRI